MYGIFRPDFFKSNSQWGDFAGGSLGPILSFFGFIGLLYTIKIQGDELSLTRDELRRSASSLEAQNKEMQKQSFENTFFKMIEFHSSIVSSLHISGNGMPVNGRDCFRSYYDWLVLIVRRNQNANEDISAIIENAYDHYWNNNSHKLGHYYRYLFNLIKFVHNNSPDDHMYIELLRAQFTDTELALLYYNTMSKHGSNFSQYAEIYNLFDNLRDDLKIK
jgi:hypothetical protein